MKRTRREWGFIFLGLAVGFMISEVKLLFQPNRAAAWVLGLLTLACLVLGFYLTRSGGRVRGLTPGRGDLLAADYVIS